MRTLATVAMGFAAAKGVDRYRQMGGMAGMQEMFRGAAGPGGMGDQIAQMADKMGVPGGGNAVRDMMRSFGMGGSNDEAAAAGFGGLMSAMGGAAAASGQQMDEMMDGLFKGTPVSMAAENNAKLMIRAMIQAAKADGEIDKEEQEKIVAQLKDAPKEEVEFVREQLAAPVDVAGLANDAGDAAKAQVYATSLMAIRVDNEQEAQYLKQLAQALGLSEDMRDRVHASMGVKPLPG
jgi:uncharacterized membrane protein YebE (DUF533 family)